MARKKKHGSKKWIVDYRGRVKRSNNRTKLDYYGDLRWWEPMEGRRWSSNKTPKNFCPQCKHVQKDIVRQQKEARAWWADRRSEYDTLFRDALTQWRDHRKWVWQVRKATGVLVEHIQYVPIPKLPEPPSYMTWVYKHYPNQPSPWSYDTRSYLCYKCERKYEVKHDQMWRYPYPGCKRYYTWVRKSQYNSYRNEVKTLMRRGWYDEEYYDDIPPKYVPGWLD